MLDLIVLDPAPLHAASLTAHSSPRTTPRIVQGTMTSDRTVCVDCGRSAVWFSTCPDCRGAMVGTRAVSTAPAPTFGPLSWLRTALDV